MGPEGAQSYLQCGHDIFPGYHGGGGGGARGAMFPLNSSMTQKARILHSSPFGLTYAEKPKSCLDLTSSFSL